MNNQLLEKYQWTQFPIINGCEVYGFSQIFVCVSFFCKFEPRHEKINVLVSEMVRHKPGCTATEDGYRLEYLDLETRGIVLSM